VPAKRKGKRGTKKVYKNKNTKREFLHHSNFHTFFLTFRLNDQVSYEEGEEGDYVRWVSSFTLFVEEREGREGRGKGKEVPNLFRTDRFRVAFCDTVFLHFIFLGLQERRGGRDGPAFREHCKEEPACVLVVR
jgi:hypothetical protein